MSKGHGWWLNQYRVKPSNDFTPAQLQCYLDIVGYFSLVFNEHKDASTRAAATLVLNNPAKSPADVIFDQHALGAWLNFANGSVSLRPRRLRQQRHARQHVRRGHVPGRAVRINPASTSAQIKAQKDSSSGSPPRAAAEGRIVIRWFPALVLIALLAGCASGGPPAQTGGSVTPQPTSSSESPLAPAPRFIGPADDGRTYALMTVGQTTTLRLAEPDATEPEVEGAAVLLIAVVNVTGSGAREWEVRPAEPGRSSIDGAVGDDSWKIALVVAD